LAIDLPPFAAVASGEQPKNMKGIFNNTIGECIQMAWPMRAGIYPFMPLNGGVEIPIIIVKKISHSFGD
jgi:hypothetical protein